MKPKELIALLEKTVPAGLPVLIKGAPGIGKSEIVAQVAEKLKAEFMVSHPVVDDPTDYKGLPAIVRDKETREKTADFLPFGNLQRLINADKLTIAFIDDMIQAPKVVQAALMQLLLARQVNGKKISDYVVFIAATNDRHHKAGGTGILEPVKSRFTTIVELDVSVDDWCDWAIANEVPPEVIALIKLRPDLLMDEKPATNDIVNRHSPRTVVNAGRLFQNGITDFEALSGAAGAAWATEFTGYIKIWKELPSFESIMLNPEEAIVPEQPAALYAISTLLSRKMQDTNIKRMDKYIRRMPEEYAVLVWRDAVRVRPEIQNNMAYIKWCSENKDIFV